MKKTIKNTIYRLLCTLALLAFIFMFPGSQAAASEDLSSQKMNAAEDTAYLKISFDKNGETITSTSSTTSIPTVNVLAFTEWQLKAEYIVIDSDGKMTKRDVTKQCTWGTDDSVGCYLSVDKEKGTVKAGCSTTKLYKVAAAYNGTYEQNGTSVTQQFSAAIKFQVKELTVSGNAEEMRCLAYNQMLMTASDFLFNGAYVGKTVSSFAYSMCNSVFHKTQYLCSNGKKNSATFENFYDGVVGDSEFLTYYSSGTSWIAAAFQSGSNIYLAFYCTDEKVEYRTLFPEVLAYYKKLNNSNVIVTGTGLGGTAAKYISYVTGCRAITFNARSPLEYVTLNNFEEFCKYYSPYNQVSLNLTGLDGSYLTEPYYTVTPASTSTSSGLNKMICYSQKNETVSFSKSSLKVTQNKTLWSRSFYFGKDTVNDTYEKEGYNPHVVFGGGGNDTVSLYADNEATRTVQEFLKVTRLLLETSPSDDLQNVATGMQMAKDGVDGKWDEVTKTAAQVAGGIVVDIKGNSVIKGTMGALSYVDTIEKGARYLATKVYPSKNILVGGKGDDTFTGTVYEDWYCYTLGDGKDEIYDGLGSSIDKIFLMGCEDADVKCTLDGEEDTLFHISVNGTTVIDFYSGNSCVGIYIGSPFSDAAGGVFKTENMKTAQITRACQVACPVDVNVYDSSDNLVVTMKDGEESYVENDYGSFTVVNQNDEYIKSFTLYDKTCKVELVGTGTGKMKFSAAYFDDEGISDQYAAIADIDVEEGERFYLSDDMTTTVLLVDRDGDGTVDGSVDRNTTLEIAEEELTLPAGSQQQLTISYSSNSVDNGYVWISEDTDIAEFDEQGILLAKKVGSVVVGAIALDGTVYDTCKVTVTEADLTSGNLTVEGLKESYEYTGCSQDIELSVSYNGILLQEGTDYTLEFSELTDPGEASVIIRGIGSYTGQKTLNYSIVMPAEIETVEDQIAYIAGKCRAENFTDEYSIAVYLHDWLINYANYDYTYTYYDSDGVLVHKTGVCQSYANAYSLLLDEFDIENQVIASADMNHAWNLVKLDGEWCHIDCTWDDPGNGGAENHDYFGLNDDLMSRDHVWDTSSYTACSSLQNYYYMREGYRTFESDEEFAAIMEEISSDAVSDTKLCYIGTDSSYNLMDKVLDFIAHYDWKYGITGYNYSGNAYVVNYSAEYGEPWEQPAEFTGVADMPYFVLRGPEGMYRSSDYQDNGIILIFGREGCFNTRGLLDQLYASLEELRTAGVEVIVNVIDAEEEEDFGYLSENYPDFVYTYGDYSVLYACEDAVGTSYSTFPIVFFVNKNSRITYSSGGYVTDIDGFIANALEIETDSPLPTPTDDGSGYVGSYYCYTGEKTDSMVLAIQDQLKAKRTVLYAYDGLYESDNSTVSDMLAMIREIAEDLKEYDCDYTIDYSMYYYIPDSPVFGVPVSYDSHDVVEDPAIEPTCTEKGCTAGQHCSICGKVLAESEEISPLGHNLTLIPGTEPTCSEEGTADCYYCEDCGKYFTDSYGTVEISGPQTLPAAHVYTQWISNGDGTHQAVCGKDSSHVMTENCSYSYSVVESASEGQNEKGRYTCQKCGYSFLVERADPENSQIVLSENHFYYDGTEKKPEVTIEGLTENVDYTVSYENNVNPGTGVVRITGIGNYTGIVEVTFEIETRPAIEILTQPEDLTVSIGEKYTFKVSAESSSNETLTYLWRYSKDDGITWLDTTRTKDNYSTTAKKTMDGWLFMCLISDKTGNVIATDPARLTVRPEIEISTHPSSVTAVAGEKFTFSVSAVSTLNNTLTYEWQISKDNGITWTASSQTKSSYSTTAKTSMSGWQYRCLVTDTAGNQLTSASAVLTVKPAIEITSQTDAQTVNAGELYKFRVTAVSNTGSKLTYLWQYSKTLKGWTDTTRTLNNYGTYATVGVDGKYFRCKITDEAGNVVYSTPAMLRVLSDITITKQPEDTMVASGKRFYFTVTATGSSLTYLWQYSTDGGKTWTDTSRTKNNYTTYAKTAMSGRMFRCVIKDSSNNSVITEAGTLTVQ